MDAYREVKPIGNEFIPIRLYNIKTDKYNRLEAEVISGLGNEIKKGQKKTTRIIPHSILPHWHSYLEIIYFVEGSANMQLNNHSFELSPGDVILVDVYDIHNLTGKCKHLALLIDPSQILHIKENYEIIFPKSIRSKILSSSDVSTQLLRKNIIDNINTIYNLYIEKPVGYSLDIISKLYNTLSYIQKHSHNTNLSSLSPTINNKENLLKINRILNFISKNYANSISLQDAANVVNYSPNYFCRFFKKHMGRSFYEYLNLYRCTKAEMLILTTSKTITEIAHEVGFSSVSYFDKVYKKIKGYTPSKERRST